MSEIRKAIEHSRLKIEWAKEHIDQVEACIRHLVSEDGYVIRPEQNPRNGQYALYVGPPDGFPAQLPLAIGDAVHGLNTVMDYLWSGLARTANSQIVSKITFPRHETRENLLAQLTNGNHATLKHAFPQAEAFVCDLVKPYRGGNDLVWGLNKLDNVNKHRMLIPVIYIMQFGKLVAEAENGGVIDISFSTVVNRGPSYPIALGAPFKVNDDAKATIELFLQDVEVFRDEPIVPLLRNLASAVSEVVDIFEKVFVTS